MAVVEASPITTPPARAPVAWLPVGGVAVALAVVLAATSGRYGYHRDELYFRMLEPAWGYVDQPPFTPWLARTLAGAFEDSLAVLRVPAVAGAVAAVVVVALLARELGGRAGAQGLAAAAYATSATPLIFGHTFLTASVDLVVWAAVLWLAVRALLRDPRWWVAAGAVAGLGSYNKLLVVVLLAALLAGLAAAGPRRVLGGPWIWAGAGAALLLAAPQVVYQATHGWPQVAMGRALGGENGADVRVEMWSFQLLALGPLHAVLWVAGAVALWRRPAWRPLRCLVLAYPLLLAFTYVGGAQVYYATGLLAAFLAAGAVVAAGWARTTARRVAVGTLLAVDAAGAALIALPLVPVTALGGTPVPDVNQTAADSVGWPAYAAQVAAVHAALPPADRAHAVVVTQNYGEAGAVHRFAPHLPVYSGHNALHALGPPDADATVAVVVADGVARWSRSFGSCEVRDRLDNGVGVDSEEQGVPVMVCRDPVGGWGAVWPRLAHLD